MLRVARGCTDRPLSVPYMTPTATTTIARDAAAVELTVALAIGRLTRDDTEESFLR